MAWKGGKNDYYKRGWWGRRIKLIWNAIFVPEHVVSYRPRTLVDSASHPADIKQDNWLAVTDGYARQRNVRGWPVGVGWPKNKIVEETGKELDKAVAAGSAPPEKAKAAEAEDHNAVGEAQKEQEGRQGADDAEDLGYCTIWVGTKQERSSAPPPPSKALDPSSSAWSHVSSPKAGLALVYMPLLPNPRVPGVDPRTTDFLSTWNFVYTPEQVDDVADLAKANYEEGRGKVKMCVRSVYERRKAQREEREERKWELKYRSLVRKGVTHSLGEGDHFS